MTPQQFTPPNPFVALFASTVPFPFHIPVTILARVLGQRVPRMWRVTVLDSLYEGLKGLCARLLAMWASSGGQSTTQDVQITVQRDEKCEYSRPSCGCVIKEGCEWRTGG